MQFDRRWHISNWILKTTRGKIFQEWLLPTLLYFNESDFVFFWSFYCVIWNLWDKHVSRWHHISLPHFFWKTIVKENLLGMFLYAHIMRDHLQFSLLLLTEFKGINLLLFPLKSSENLLFFDDFRGNRS